MARDDIDERYDLAQIIVRPLYYGLTFNVIIPMALLLVCYWLNENHEPRNILGVPRSNILFYIMAAVAIGHAGVALWWKNNKLKTPMQLSRANFQAEFAEQLLAKFKPVALLIASLALYGYAFFFITGRFKPTVMFVVFSFVVFQVARPRYGFVRELIADEETRLDKQASARATNSGSE